MISKDPFPLLECVRCETFVTDESLSIAEQNEQMKQHLEVAHPYWDLENIGAEFQTYKANFRRKALHQPEHICPNCRSIVPYTKFCPHCGASTTESIETNHAYFDSLNKSSQRKQFFAIMGSILLFIGVFTPIVSVPIVGNMNYFQNGRGDGVIVLVLAVISIVLTIAKKYRGLWLTGPGSFAVLVFTFANFQIRMSEIQDEMETRLAGNPFRDIADVAVQSVQLQWGWAVLVVGAVFLITAAAIREERRN